MKMTPNDFDLLQRHQDGELTPAELQRVEALLATDPDARVTAAALKALASGLEAGEQTEHSGGAVHEIMARVHALPRPDGPTLTMRLRHEASRIFEQTAN
ncbi:MAG TPA: hypothetical protein VM493_07185, partial [Vicinamibacterales bacterium]|nr:hypothetical protein [Vicinamibacterales bacterium]